MGFASMPGLLLYWAAVHERRIEFAHGMSMFVGETRVYCAEVL